MRPLLLSLLRPRRDVVHPQNSLLVALLLSLSGGFLDAFTFVGHHGVFANAMTGNVVFVGMSIAQAERRMALEHLYPILAFLVGILIAHLLRFYVAGRSGRQLELFCLAAEIATLAFLATLPRQFPDVPIVLAISFVAALQTASFTRIQTWSYNSVVTTANLRRFAEGLFKGILPRRDAEALEQARVFGTICLSFLAGAGLGAYTTARHDNAALWLPVVLLGAALLRCWMLRPGV